MKTSNPPSPFLANRPIGHISLAKELIINTFFISIRDNLAKGTLTRDEEILLVLQCMNDVFNDDEDTNASILSKYLGIKV
tara:strand:+ start:149 stop:388 length:240 start_codon:yes stop_codon:yes gene_type:complete